MKIAICDDEKKASEALLEILEECPEPIEKNRRICKRRRTSPVKRTVRPSVSGY